MYQTLLTTLENGILTITINRADKLNALNKMVIAELEEVVSEIKSNNVIKSAIITGAGEKAFIAGADISEFAGFSSGEGMDLARRGQEVFFEIENQRKGRNRYQVKQVHADGKSHHVENQDQPAVSNKS